MLENPFQGFSMLLIFYDIFLYLQADLEFSFAHNLEIPNNKSVVPDYCIQVAGKKPVHTFK